MKENIAEEHGLLPARPLPTRGAHVQPEPAVAFDRGREQDEQAAAALEHVRAVDGREAAPGDRVPNYAELCECKRVFVGPDRPAYQVHPREAEHENLHAYCLHLWAPVGFDPLPDFRFDGGGV